MFEDKVWGKVWHIFISLYSAVSYLEVNEGFCCSKHYHEDRVNVFAVTSGKLLIQQWPHGVLRENTLKAQEGLEVPAGILHRFVVLESGNVIEIYYPKNGNSVVRFSDIVRENEGGPFDISDYV